MNQAALEPKQIFLEAIEKLSPEEMIRYLDETCQGNPDLRGRVEQLLRGHLSAGKFLGGSGDRDATVAPAVSERAGGHIGPYKLLQQIGEGGFGVVFMADQTDPVRRRVALKIIKAGMDTRQVVARFEAERQALALMDHPNIAHVLGGGETVSGRPYFVMELVRGAPITDFFDANHAPVGERLELFIAVCQAVQHAHLKGVIHRDIKPSNILVTLHDGVPVPKVIDFGISKAISQHLTEKTLFTSFGEMIGTPQYMSPEQAELSGLDIDTRSDIYSLGVLLYELLTGATPCDKERLKTAAFDEIRRMIREDEPAIPSRRISTMGAAASLVSANRMSDPRRLSQLVRGELDWIVMKSLEKDRNRRYETASALAADVRRFLNDEPVHAFPPSTFYRLRKLARRQKAALISMSAIAMAALLAVVALAVSTGLVWRANQKLRTEVYFQRIAMAHRELSTDNLGRALKLLEECPEDLREWEWRYLMRLCRVEPLVLRDKTEVNGVAFSPDGERLASAGGDGTVKIWNSRTGAVVQTFPAHADSVVSVAFHPDGQHLASRGADRKVKVWDLTAAGQAVFTEPCDPVRKFGTAYTVAFSPDGRLLGAGTDGVVRIWDWKKRQLLHSLPGHNFHSIPVTFSGDGRLATGLREGLKLWNPETGMLIGAIGDVRGPFGAVAFSPDGKWLASASFDRTVKLSDATTGKLLHTLDLHTGNVECVAFSPDGRLLASGGEDKTVRIWESTTGREVLGLHGHTERCACVAFSPDGRRLASASSDGAIRIWDGAPLRGDERGQEILTFAEHGDEIRSVALSPEGQQIASADQDGLVKVWDAQTHRVSAEFRVHQEFSGIGSAVFCVVWRPKGHIIASAGLDTVRAWDVRTGREVFRLPAPLGKIALPYHAVAFSPDGRYLVTGKVDGSVQIWDGQTGQEVGALDTHKREIRGVVFSKGGEHLATASSDGIVKLWDATRLDKKRLHEKQEARLILRAGRRTEFERGLQPGWPAAGDGGRENRIKIWDVETGELLQTLEGEHSGEVYTLAFSPDGQCLASGGEDSAVKIWDSHAGTLVRSFRGHTGVVSSLAFSPDGRYLVSGSRDKTVKVWDVTQLKTAPDR